MKKLEGKWDAWFNSEGVNSVAFVSRDQPLERLKGSVHEYGRPFDPVDIEDWEALDLELGGTVQGDDIPIHRTPTGTRYVRILEIPGQLQGKFMRYLRGSAMPVVDGEEGPVAFKTDWLGWCHHRRPDRSAKHRNTAMSAAVMRTILNIAREWGLHDAEMAALLGPEVETYRAWSHAPSQASLEAEQSERASLLLGIYQSLVTLLPLSNRECHWLYQPIQGTPFQGSAPIERLRHGGLTALRELREHVDELCQGGFARSSATPG
jgi:hypothetical protein